MESRNTNQRLLHCDMDGASTGGLLVRYPDLTISFCDMAIDMSVNNSKEREREREREISFDLVQWRRRNNRYLRCGCFPGVAQTVNQLSMAGLLSRRRPVVNSPPEKLHIQACTERLKAWLHSRWRNSYNSVRNFNAPRKSNPFLCDCFICIACRELRRYRRLSFFRLTCSQRMI